MSLLYYRNKPDRRAGFVLIAVFMLGVVGALLATAMNGGHMPEQPDPAIVYLTKITAPM
jgi:hypothetical protein